MKCKTHLYYLREGGENQVDKKIEQKILHEKTLSCLNFAYVEA